MIPEFTENPLFFAWPFWVLELTPDSSIATIEKQVRDLTNKLKFGVPGIEVFNIPGETKVRDEYLIRDARDYLHDPKKRLIAEFWYVDLHLLDDKSSKEPSDGKKDINVNWLDELGVNLWC